MEEEIKNKIDLALKFLENVQSLIRFADSKINVLLVISGVTTTFVMTNIVAIDKNIIAKIVFILFLLAFAVFVCLSLLTISPRRDKHSGNTPPKLIYFGHIAERKEVQDYINDYNNALPESFLKDIQYQIYENSKIASTKFKWYAWSLKVLYIQLFLFLIILVLIKFC